MKKILKSLLISLVIFLLVFTVMVADNYIKPKPIEAEPITLAVLLYIATALAVCGVIYQERQTIVDLANKFWDWVTLDRRPVIVAEAEEARTTGVADYTDVDWAEYKDFIDEHLDDEVYPQTISTEQIKAIFGDVVLTNVEGNYSGSTQITSALYWGATSYSSISFNGYTVTYSGDWDIWNMYINGSHWSNWAPDSTGLRFNIVKWYVEHETRYEYLNRSGVVTLHQHYYGRTPVFSFFYDTQSGHIYPVLLWFNFNNAIYRADGLGRNYDGSLALGMDIYTDVKEYKAILDPVITRDPDYDIVIDDHRYVDMVKDISQLVEVTAADILEGTIKDITLELQELDVPLGIIANWQEYVEKLDYLEQLTYLQELVKLGELEFTEEGELVVSATIVNQWELDIPETEFNLPVIEVLANKFPFCIPFDLYYAVANLQADPVAPEFEINFPAAVFGGEGNMTLDFSVFEVVAVVIRWTILLGFIIGLIVLTRKLIRG